jgi:hypothetical protein
MALIVRSTWSARADGIPLKMKRAEWDAYFREHQAQALMDYCRQLQSLPAVVKHPAFMSFPVLEREPDAEFLRLLEGYARYDIDV